jgi:hypothetical protein
MPKAPTNVRLEPVHHGPASPDDLLDIAAAAEVLSIPPKTLIGLYQGHRVPVCRIGRSIRFLRSDLVSYIQQHRTPAA